MEFFECVHRSVTYVFAANAFSDTNRRHNTQLDPLGSERYNRRPTKQSKGNIYKNETALHRVKLSFPRSAWERTNRRSAALN